MPTELVPGQSFDLLIAKLVMGWRVEQHPAIPDAYHVRDVPWCNDMADFDPSTSMGCAWHVVEHMVKQGKKFELFSHGHDNELWDATIGTHTATSKTPELAICHAAMLASFA